MTFLASVQLYQIAPAFASYYLLATLASSTEVYQNCTDISVIIFIQEIPAIVSWAKQKRSYIFLNNNFVSYPALICTELEILLKINSFVKL